MQQKILNELHLYKIGADHFGSDFAMAQRKTHSPSKKLLSYYFFLCISVIIQNSKLCSWLVIGIAAYWWRMFGSQTPNLQKLAIKILSLTCSASGCERNWSVFE